MTSQSHVRVLLAVMLPAFLLAMLPRGATGQSVDPIPIYVLQGDGASSPLRGRYVDAVGLVTGVGPQGFHLQDPSGDGNSETSDGIYVYTRQRPAVTPGTCVLVRGALIDEFYDKTELSRAREIEPSSACGGASVPAVTLPLPRFGQDPAQLYEPYEGMLVTLPAFDAVVHGPTKRFDSGDVEIAVVPRRFQPYVSDGRVFFDEPAEIDHLLYLSGALGAELPDVRRGDVVNVAGGAPAVLDYNFGKYQFIPLPGTAAVMPGDGAADVGLAQAAPAGEGDFTLCTFNLKGLGQGSDQIADDARYAAEVRRRARTIAEQLGGCTVIGLQETGRPADAEALAAALRADFGLAYTATALPGPQSGDPAFPLTNAVLTRSDRVQVRDAALRQGCSPRTYDVPDTGACPVGQYPLFNRPPLVVDLAVTGAWGDPYVLTIIDNHWKSKSGDESVNAPRRLAQAEHVARIVQERLDADPNAAVVVLGDLNDYLGSAPLAALATQPAPDLVHLYDRLRPLDRYTYIFNGASQVLDHMLATPALAASVAEVLPVRVNAELPALAAPAVDDVRHASDHDPVLVRVMPGGAGWIAGNVGYGALTVELIDTADNVIDIASSDMRGDVRLWNVAPGDYRIRVSAPPYVFLPVAEVAIPVVSGENRFVTTALHEASRFGLAAVQWTAAPDMP